MRTELQESREQNLWQSEQGKPGAKGESRDARQQRGFGRERRGDDGKEQCVGTQGACAAASTALGTRMVHSDLEGDVTSKVAGSPEESLLALFSPGPKGCISAQIFQGSEGSSASFCLRPAARWRTRVQMPHPRRYRADG